jgi:selT/selW/selH-like putative selenoprotein
VFLRVSQGIINDLPFEKHRSRRIAVTITRERFEQGLTYDKYRSQMTRNEERFDETERTVVLSPEDIAFFASLPAPLNVLVLAEDWCGDVIANLPLLGRLAEASGKLKLRIFLRDQNPDLMDQYLKEGQFRSIPVFVFLDENFNEIGHWIERPTSMTKLVQEVRLKHFASDPELAGVPPTTSPSELPEDARLRLMQTLATFRAEKRPFSDSEVVREIREILTGVAPKANPTIEIAAASQPAWKQATRPPAEQPVKVSITYCAECGYEPQTIALTSALMLEFRNDLASIEIIPWHDGMFDVVVDGQLVHSMMRDGGFPENTTIVEAVRSRLGVAQPT